MWTTLRTMWKLCTMVFVVPLEHFFVTTNGLNSWCLYFLIKYLGVRSCYHRTAQAFSQSVQSCQSVHMLFKSRLDSDTEGRGELGKEKGKKKKEDRFTSGTDKFEVNILFHVYFSSLYFTYFESGFWHISVIYNTLSTL